MAEVGGKVGEGGEGNRESTPRCSKSESPGVLESESVKGDPSASEVLDGAPNAKWSKSSTGDTFFFGGKLKSARVSSTCRRVLKKRKEIWACELTETEHATIKQCVP